MSRRAQADEDSPMQLRYFVVDVDNQLIRVPQNVVEGWWKERRTVHANGVRLVPEDVFDTVAYEDDGPAELKLVTVLCDEDFLPKICYFLRLELCDDRVTDDSRQMAIEAVSESNQYNFDHSAVLHQLAAWPCDWQAQVAVAMDVPIDMVQKVGVGGPLPLADLLGLPMDKLLACFDEAFHS